MSEFDLENSIVKYLCNEVSTEDLDRLSEWITDSENQKKFERYVVAHYKITTAMNEPDVDKIKKGLISRIRRDKRQKRTRLFATNVLKYAAVALVFLGIGYILKYNLDPKIQVQGQIIAPKSETVTIEGEGGKVQKLNTDADNRIIRGKNGQAVGVQQGTRLVYNDLNEKELIYNTIHVPFGKRFDVVLSDGSHVYLNAGTSLKYPINFIKDRDREVYLEGEAFFEVAKQKESPFMVNVGDMSVQVLGTEFNVSNYPDVAVTQTVLVEGSVALRNKMEQSPDLIRLEPGQKGQWNKGAHKIQVTEVDTYLYTSWMQGKLIFRDTPFKNIRKALERKYNVRIKNLNAELDQQRFDAAFDIETINEIIESFNRSFNIEYKIVNNEVIIQ